MTPNRVFRSGVRFDYPQCGKLWKDDKQHGKVLKNQCIEWVGDLIKAYESHQVEKLGTADAKDSYSLLSEFSHPNSACLQHYHTYNPPDVELCPPSLDASSLPIVNWCLIDLLLFLQTILAMAKETSILPDVAALVKKIASLAPRSADAP